MGTLRDLQFALQLKIEELRQRDTLIDELELELDTKDDLIRRLQGELDRFRATVSPPGHSASSSGCSEPCDKSQRSKRKTIFSEPLNVDPKTFAATSQNRPCSKTPGVRELIQTAFLENTLLRHLECDQIRTMIDCMYPTTVDQGFLVIQEGARGNLAYVLEEGRMEVTKDAQKLLTIEVGQVFGEAALLYSCSYTYSISALTNSKLWVIDRGSFQSVMIQSSLSSLSRSMELLCSVSFLRSLPEDVLMKMADMLEEAHYTEGDYIIRQGTTGDSFYIISKGQVKVTEKKVAGEVAELSTLSQGHWFGEKALRGDDVRTANVIAVGDVTCLVIDRNSFKQIMEGVADDTNDAQESVESEVNAEEEDAVLGKATLSDFQVVCNLGVGEMGHTDLVKLHKGCPRCPFAMRVFRRRLLRNSERQEHILRERHNLTHARCPFIVRLHRTFKDARCLYMLTEACLGGELWSLLRDREMFDGSTTRFYTACVVEALDFLHRRGIVYRDLKPENVILDHRGYVKLMGLGCAKKLGLGRKTWTMCGTPGYMAPEVILNKGHSLSADLWSLGVFVFELLSGSLPFSGPDHMRTFAATLRGIDLVEFPKTIGRNASSLIRKLCRTNPSERLGNQRKGAKDIQKHKWFEGFNWEGLTKGTLAPPIIPKPNSHLESSRMDPRPDNLEEELEEGQSDWDKDF